MDPGKECQSLKFGNFLYLKKSTQNRYKLFYYNILHKNKTLSKSFSV